MSEVIQDSFILLDLSISPNVVVFQSPLPQSVLSSCSTLPSFLIDSLSSMSKRSDNHSPTVFIDPKLQITSDLSSGILTLEECLQSYFHREVMDFSAEYTCEKCGRVVEVLRDIQMEHPPQILILHLMRFAFDTYSAVKLYEDVEYPIIVRVNPPHDF